MYSLLMGLAAARGVEVERLVGLVAKKTIPVRYILRSCAISGNILVASAVAEDAHSISVYRARDGAFTHAQTLSGYGGISLAISGNILLTKCSNASVVCVLRSDDGSFGQTYELTASDQRTDDWFGLHFAISESTAVVTALFHRDLDRMGAVYVFRTTDDGRTFSQTQKLAPDSSQWWWFGTSVAISSTLVVVGSLDSAYIFRATNGVFAQTQQLMCESFPNGVVATSGNTVVIGSGSDDGYPGEARIFRATDGLTFTHTQTLNGDEATYGGVIAISNNTIVVGNNAHDNTALVFRTTDGGLNFSLARKLTANDTSSFGCAVATSGELVVVEASQEHGDTVSYVTYVFGAPNKVVRTNFEMKIPWIWVALFVLGASALSSLRSTLVKPPLKGDTDYKTFKVAL